ncbi:MAG: dihydroorotase [Acidobacteria bacterium]|nr:dihydroorotase [Acidobacteriota bacterium]MCI0724630.1 dihydroorotase [Acidobacteriota bacterium]
MSSLLIKNGRIIDPASNIDQVGDLLIEKGKVSRIEHGIQTLGIPSLDVSGLVVSPGFIDIHVHLREPGREDEETIESGSQAAAAGGFTSICCMPNTDPINDTPTVTHYIVKEAERRAVTRVFPIGAISIGSAGEKLAEIGEMVEAGAVGISDDGKPVMNGQLMRRAMEYSLPFKIPVIEHCEDLHLSAHGSMNEGYQSTVLGLKGISRTAEDTMASRDIILAELTGAHIHIAHLSTRGALDLVRAAKQKGIHATCEVTPHHFTLTDAACCSYDTNTKMNPPLRADDDVEALIEGLADGTIDCIATDHAPHNPNEKMLEFDRAPFGITGLETALGLALTKLVHTGKISLKRLVELFTINPARIINKSLGTLQPGAEGDITLFSLDSEWVYDVNQTKSKSRNCPFHGMKLKGQVAGTVVAGKVVHRNENLLKTV